MPTENELKYVLKLNCEPVIVAASGGGDGVSQGYLVANKGVSLRVRSVRRVAGGMKYTMTYKHSVKKRVVEIETEIDRRDFDDLWGATVNRVVKTRHKVKDAKNQVWEIDFFKDHDNQNYFAMAELEMPEGQTAPVLIPPFIQFNLLYAVPLEDGRFASKLLADVRYAKAILKTLETA